MEEAGRQAGIDPGAVRAAAVARLPEPPRSMATVLRGGPALREHTVDLPGRLPPARHRELADALDRTLATDGSLESDRPSAFAWREDHTQGRTRVVVEDHRAGGTSVTVRADRRGWAAALNVAGLAVGVGAGAVVLWATGSALAALGGGVLAWRGLVRLVWRPYARRLGRRLEAAVAEVVTRLEDSSG